MSRVRVTVTEGDRLVNRLKNTNLDKFHTLCKMHLSFLLDLPGSSLEDILGGDTCTPGSTPISAEKSKHHFRHFGRKKNCKENRIRDTIGQGILDQVLPLVEYLGVEQSLTQEGLFRKNGHIGRQKLLREKLQNGEDVSLELENGVYSAHDCANVLKSCLSDLTEPVLTDRLYQAFCQVSRMEHQDKQLQTLQLLLQLLPSENLLLLHSLLTLLHKATEEASNKMTSETLGTLFAPHLLVPRKMSGRELHAVASNLTKTVALMIESVPFLFKLPALLVKDVATYWSQMEALDGESELLSCVTSDTPNRIRYQRRSDPSDAPISTAVTFTDRQASLEAAAKTDTKMALAELHAHISSMPESAKKKRLLKQFNKANAPSSEASSLPSKHKRTRSVGDSIKKLMSRNHRRHRSRHMLQFNNLDDSLFSYKHMPSTKENSINTTPVTTPAVKLFAHDSMMCSRRSPVHIVDLKENVAPPVHTRKRKSPFVESPVPVTPECGSVFLSPLRDFTVHEHPALDRTPFVIHTKKRILATNQTRLTI